ncbi:(2Fe-2S)-binding protein [Cohnella lupini]
MPGEDSSQSCSQSYYKIACCQIYRLASGYKRCTTCPEAQRPQS